MNLSADLDDDAALELACKKDGHEVPKWLRNAQEGADDGDSEARS